MKVAVIGYRKVAESPQLRAKIEEEILNLIESGADTFYFCGTKNGFDCLCYEAVGKLAQNKNIKRVLARAHYECVSIEEDIFEYLIEFTEERAFCANSCSHMLTVYIKPFKDIIDLSDVLLTYMKASGDRQLKFVVNAVKYAKIRKKKIINVFKLL